MNTDCSSSAPRSSMLIRDMEAETRPREKAMRHGMQALTDAELMAVIFSTGIKGKNVIELSRDILNDNGKHLSKVARLSVSDFLKRYKGIGPAKALTLLAALEIGARAAADAAQLNEPVITSSRSAAAIMIPRLERIPHEEFWVVLLSRAGKVIREVNIGRGGVSSTIVDIRLIFKAALDSLASAIILYHNHPSGSVKPSLEDDRLTTNIVQAAKLFGINVHDHIIIAHGNYYSYHDNGHIL